MLDLLPSKQVRFTNLSNKRHQTIYPQSPDHPLLYRYGGKGNEAMSAGMNIGDREDYWQSYRFPTTLDKDAPLHTSPHYTDKRFNKEQAVFGKHPKSRYGHDNLKYDYSDRLWQWDYDKAEKSVEVANASGATLRSCKRYEAYLSAYFNKPIEIKHIIAGVNRGNGYPYCVFGYKSADS